LDTRRAIRGGSWLYVPFFCRTVSRDGFAPTVRSYDGGFRVVCEASSP
jgi:formylglycine-generating enzyme required for sulfatase activity